MELSTHSPLQGKTTSTMNKVLASVMNTKYLQNDRGAATLLVIKGTLGE